MKKLKLPRVFGGDLEKRIKELESTVGKEQEKETGARGFWNIFDSYLFSGWGARKTLWGEAKSIRKDFEELDRKFDALERYLQIEYYKSSEETQIYDWAGKEQKEGFRKAKKTYEQEKKSREEKKEDDDD